MRRPIAIREFFCWLAVLIAVSAFCGCGRVSARDLDLNEEVAHASLERFFEAWKSGQSQTDLGPDIIAADEAWEAGARLLSFKIQPSGLNDGTNLHITAELVLAQPGNAPRAKSGKPKRVTYVVGTSPVITIFRE
jgi:hypothetical protein